MIKIFITAILSTMFLSIFCQSEYGEELIIFIGEKIDINEVEPDMPEGSFSLNHVYNAKYKVIKSVYGSLDTDTIIFKVGDHYGYPNFAKFQHVLLYILKYEQQYYHLKYTYDPLFRTQEGGWAGYYAATEYIILSEEGVSTNVVPTSINFEPSVELNTNEYNQEYLLQLFPEPYFQIKDTIATAIYGHYVKDLIQLKREAYEHVDKYFK